MQKAGALEITWNHSISVFTYCQMGIQCTRNTYFLLKHRLLQNNSTTFSWYFSTWHNRRSVEFSFFFKQLTHMHFQWDDAWMDPGEGSNCSGPLLSSTLYFKMTSKLEKIHWTAPLKYKDNEDVVLHLKWTLLFWVLWIRACDVQIHGYQMKTQ